MESPNTTLEELILTIFEEDFECSQIVRVFPNLSSLSLETVSWDQTPDVAPDVPALNSPKNLKSLYLSTASEQTLKQLEIGSLTSIGIYLDSTPDKATWDNFIRKHSDLTYLKTSGMTIELIENILVDLPKLEVLCLSLAQITDDNERLAIETIEKLFAKLDDFSISVKFTNPEAIACLKIKCPGISFEKAERGRFLIRKTEDCLGLWSRKELELFYKTLG
jgi:hypothetical protein